MNLNRSTALMLRVGIVVGMILIVVGLCLDMTGGGGTLLFCGMLVLILSPFLSIIVSLAALISERDWHWVAVAVVLLAITIVGILIAM